MSEFHAAADVSRKNALDALHSEFDDIHSPERVDQLFDDSLQQYARGRLSVSTAASGEIQDVDPLVNEALLEIEAEVEGSYSKPLTPEVLGAADVIVTMARSVGEISIPGHTRHLDWRVGDPGGADLEEVRRIRDDIARRVHALIDELDPRDPAS